MDPVVNAIIESLLISLSFFYTLMLVPRHSQARVFDFPVAVVSTVRLLSQ